MQQYISAICLLVKSTFSSHRSHPHCSSPNLLRPLTSSFTCPPLFPFPSFPNNIHSIRSILSLHLSAPICAIYAMKKFYARVRCGDGEPGAKPNVFMVLFALVSTCAPVLKQLPCYPIPPRKVIAFSSRCIGSSSGAAMVSLSSLCVPLSSMTSRSCFITLIRSTSMTLPSTLSRYD